MRLNAARTMTPGIAAFLLAARMAAADGLWTDAPEARPAISHYGVMVEARTILGAADMYNAYHTEAAKLFAEFLAVPDKSPALGVIGIRAKRYGSFMGGHGGQAVSVYLVRLGVGGASQAGAADVFEANWFYRDRFYALGVPPGVYAVAAIAADDTEAFSGRGRYLHQNFYLGAAALLSTSVAVGAGEFVFAGEVAIKSAPELEIMKTKDKSWKESWQAKGMKRKLRFIGWNGWWVYQSSVAEDIGIDLARMSETFVKLADPVQARIRGLVNAASAFPLPGLAVKVELDRSPRTRETFMDNMVRDLEASPWGAKPAARRDGQPPLAAAIVPVAAAPGVPGAAMSGGSAATTAPVGAPADAVYAEATALYRTKNYDGAWGKAVEALRLDPRHWKSWALIGNCQLAKGDKAGAIKSYRTALDLNPDNPPLTAWMEQNGK